MRNDPKFELQLDAGHAQFSTTERYLHLESARRRGFGVPFPMLPEGSFDQGNDRAVVTSWDQRESEVRTGFEPAYNGFANRCLTAWLPHRA